MKQKGNQDQKVVFTNCNVYTGVMGSGIVENAEVFVNAGKIEKVAANLKESDIPADYERVDLHKQYLIPGMINLHAHLFGSGKPSKMLGGGGAQQSVIRFVNTRAGHPIADMLVKQHITQSLNSGVTTIRSSGDFCYSDVRVRDQINSGKLVGPRLIVPGPAITCIGGHGDGTFGKGSNDPQELVSFANENAKQGVDYIKICVTGGVMDAKVKGEPGIVKMTPEQTKAVCDRAHELGFKVASHTESTKGIKVALEGGVDTIEHGSVLDDELIALFKEKGAAYIVTISPALPLAKLPTSITLLDDMCLYNAGIVMEGIIEGGKQALANGIPVGLGTDESCPLVTPYSMWREINYFARYCGVSNEMALYTGTLGNAKILKIDDVTGSIEAGKDADLIVVKENPLKDLTTLSEVQLVMARGHLIHKPVVKKNAQVDAWLDSIRDEK